VAHKGEAKTLPAGMKRTDEDETKAEARAPDAR
jgi:hypothetical protein